MGSLLSLTLSSPSPGLQLSVLAQKLLPVSLSVSKSSLVILILTKSKLCRRSLFKVCMVTAEARLLIAKAIVPSYL